MASRSSCSGNTALWGCLLFWEYCFSRAASSETLPLESHPENQWNSRLFFFFRRRPETQPGKVGHLIWEQSSRGFSPVWDHLPAPGCLTILVFIVRENPPFFGQLSLHASLCCDLHFFFFFKFCVNVCERWSVLFQNGNVYAFGKKAIIICPFFCAFSTYVIFN